jgi:hypothetical protein
MATNVSVTVIVSPVIKENCSVGDVTDQLVGVGALMSMVTSGASPEPFTVLPNKVPDNLTCMVYFSGKSYYIEMASGVLTDVAGYNFAGINDSGTWAFSAASLSRTVAWSGANVSVADGYSVANVVPSLSLMTISPVPLAMVSLNVATRLLFGAIVPTVFTVFVGTAVSTVIAKTAETSLTLPAASVACAVTLCNEPADKSISKVKLPPLFTVTVPNEVVRLILQVMSLRLQLPQ